jgi:hypothetical protein
MLFERQFMALKTICELAGDRLTEILLNSGRDNIVVKLGKKVLV